MVFYNVGAIVGYLTSGFVADLLGRPGADRADLSASGFFTTDHAVMFTQQSAHGRIHGLLGAVVFLVMPTCCFLLAARSRRDARPRRWRSSTLGVAIALVVLMVLLKVSEVPTLALLAWKGLVQRIVLMLFLA